MASAKNDAQLGRTVEGTINYYDNHKCWGTAGDKALAARLGGHSYNILNNHDRDEIYLRNLRHDDHCIDRKGRSTKHMFEGRRRKFAIDERNHVKECLAGPDEHPRGRQFEQRRTEVNLAQIENSQSWAGFQNRTASLFPTGKRRYTISNKLYANEAGKLNPRFVGKGEFLNQRGQEMRHSMSAPSVAIADPAASLQRAVNLDSRKDTTQRQTESAHFAPWISHNTYVSSLEGTVAGREHKAAQQYCSVQRLENYEHSIARKNNHFSSTDKLTRSDPYFMRPRLGMTNNSVKYDIVSNERRWFKY